MLILKIIKIITIILGAVYLFQCFCFVALHRTRSLSLFISQIIVLIAFWFALMKLFVGAFNFQHHNIVITSSSAKTYALCWLPALAILRILVNLVCVFFYFSAFLWQLCRLSHYRHLRWSLNVCLEKRKTVHRTNECLWILIYFIWLR